MELRTLQLALKLGLRSPTYVRKWSEFPNEAIMASGSARIRSKFRLVITFAVSSASGKTPGATSLSDALKIVLRLTKSYFPALLKESPTKKFGYDSNILSV